MRRGGDEKKTEMRGEERGKAHPKLTVFDSVVVEVISQLLDLVGCIATLWAREHVEVNIAHTSSPGVGD